MELVPIKIYGWDEPILLPKSVRRAGSNHQKRTLSTKRKKIDGYTTSTSVTPTVRWDDQCGNGHNSFSVTASTVDFDDKGMIVGNGGGCCHDVITKTHPEIAHLIRWHLCSSDGPMHYLANTLYHALEHGPKYAHVYFEDKNRGVDRQCIKYCDPLEARKTFGGDDRYIITPDPTSSKVRNLDYARDSACWPEATDEQLTSAPEDLKRMLIERLPALMIQMYQEITDFGFIY